ncbi:MAG: spermidine synthase [Candidatus Micrarchaeia archaeon]
MKGKEDIKIDGNGDTKVLKYNGITYSAANANSIYTHLYWDYFIPLPLLFEKPKVLIIGLGGGTIPYQLSTLYKDIEIEIAEINERMVSVTKEFTGLDLSKFKLYIEDGAEVVRRKRSEYNIIILDAYINDRIPKQFLQEDFISNAYLALKEDGILAINYARRLSLMLEYISYKSKLKKFFNLYELKKGINSKNSIFIATKKLTGAEIFAILKSKIVDPQGQFLLDAYSRIV